MRKLFSFSILLFLFILIGWSSYGCGGGSSSPTTTVSTSTSTTTSTQASDSWEERTGMPTNRANFASAVYGDKIYLFGGVDQDGVTLTTVEVYSTTNDAWSVAAPLPVFMNSFTATTIGNKIYIISYNKTYEYSPESDSYVLKTPMPTPRSFAAAAVYNGIIFIIGGYHESEVVNTVEAYNPQDDAWSSVVPMSVKRANHCAITVGDTIYVMGGYYNGISSTISLETFVPDSNTWTTLDPATSSISGAIGVINNKIYFVGGPQIATSNQTLAYSPTPGAWVEKTSMPTKRMYVGYGVVEGKLYVFGGENAATRLNTVEVYQP
jgi:N-acetylneuraminic acid mutarotase